MIGVLVDQKFSQRHPHNLLRPRHARPARWCRSWPGNTTATSIRRAASACPATASGSIIEEKLDLPRDDEGKIDIAATAQLLNDVVERWVREDPGQWMWFHKRWKITRRNAPPPRPIPGEGRASAPLTAVIIHHRVPRFGEEQPALDKHAGNVDSAARPMPERRRPEPARPARRRSPKATNTAGTTPPVRRTSPPVSRHACGRLESPFRGSDSSRSYAAARTAARGR